MPGSKVGCTLCGKVMRSDNLKRHIQSCMGNVTMDTLIKKKRPAASSSPPKDTSIAGIKCDNTFSNHQSISNLTKQRKDGIRSREIPTFDGNEFNGSGKPKSKETMDKLRRLVLGDGAAMMVPSTKKARVERDNKYQDEIVNEDRNIPPQEIHTPEKMLLSLPPKQTLDILPKSTPPPSRSKGDILRYSSDESSEEDSSESTTSKSDDDELEVEEFILPDTIEGIRGRFNELYVAFVRKGKHENRSELEFLLDELLREGAIDPSEYTQLNTRLTKAEDLTIDKEEKEEAEEEDKEEENMTNVAIQYLIQHDKEELEDLMEEIKDEIEVQSMDIVLALEKLLEEFFVKEFIDEEIAIRPQINALLDQLENSKISKSKQHRIRMLLDDIEKNRYRVEQIFQRLMDAEDKEEMLTVLKTLVREGLLSDEQFNQLAELEDLDLNTIKEVITNTKVGEGLKFLPRTISNLRHTLQSLLEELKESGSTLLKSKITAIMEELLRRNAIRVEEYENLKELTI